MFGRDVFFSASKRRCLLSSSSCLFHLRAERNLYAQFNCDVLSFETGFTPPTNNFLYCTICIAFINFTIWNAKNVLYKDILTTKKCSIMYNLQCKIFRNRKCTENDLYCLHCTVINSFKHSCKYVDIFQQYRFHHLQILAHSLSSLSIVTM